MPLLTLEQKSSLAAPPLPWLSGLSPTFRASTLVLTYVVLIGFTLSPLLWASIPPLVDYPNHLARMAVLLHRGDGSAVTANYVAHWQLLPNLAMDLVVPALAQILPLELAGRLFLVSIMVMLVLGTMTLHRALHGRIALWPLCSLLFIYNAVLWFGFVNYLFGLGVALLAFSAWVASEPWPRPQRLLLFALVSSAIFVLHLFAFGVYGLLVVSFEAGRLHGKYGWSRRSFLWDAWVLLPFLPAGLLWLTAAGGPQFNAYGDIMARIYAITAPSGFGIQMTVLDTLFLIVELAVLPYALLAGRLRLLPAMRFPLIAMLIVSVLMPETLSGSWAAQLRLPIALMFVFIASTDIDSPPRRFVTLFASAFLILLGLRVATVSANWHDMDRRMTELRTALATVPEGGRLLTVQSKMPPGASRPSGWRYFTDTAGPLPYNHLDALAVIDRGVFITPLFTSWTPIAPSERNRGMSRIVGGILTPEELRARRDAAFDSPFVDQYREPLCCIDWPRHFDFVLWTDFSQEPQDLPQELQPWASGSFFHIYRIVKRPSD